MELSKLKSYSSNRLEELRSGIQETELTEEELTINNQLQEDELLVLEAIYGDNLTILKRDGQNSFQISIHIETPIGFTISADLHSFNENLKFGEQSTTSNAFEVEYLPPVLFTCLLPKSYPSHQPPLFTISSQWLDSHRVSNLCNMLDSFWTDQPGQEVIYNWLDWLHSSSLTYLGIDKELVLGQYNMPDAEDRRAISKCVSPNVDMLFMRNYNDDKCQEIFNASMHECCICFSKYAGTGFVRLPCKHFFCWKCMETYSRNHVKEEKLICPDSKCEGLIPHGLLKQLLGKEEFESLESLLLKETLDLISDVVYCPRCETACLEDVGHDAQCPSCLFSFCSLCREPRHVGLTCIGPDPNLQPAQMPISTTTENSTEETFTSDHAGYKDVILKKYENFKRFDIVGDYSDHHYANQGSEAYQLYRNWAKVIQREWKILEKDLPESISVRVYEKRMDLLRAVIVGVGGTPYHDGLFFFDVFFPCTYPNDPPRVYYRSGGLRLNPNMYACGKVCLSLLNTWEGNGKEKWNPKESTMLQVLLSIQALVLNTKPYFNEPGYASMAGTPQGEKYALAYNESTFILSCRTMLFSLKNPPKHFEEYVAGHFRARAQCIIRACQAYSKGAQVGCLAEGGVSCSGDFKVQVGTMAKTLVDAFIKNGSKKNLFRTEMKITSSTSRTKQENRGLRDTSKTKF